MPRFANDKTALLEDLPRQGAPSSDLAFDDRTVDFADLGGSELRVYESIAVGGSSIVLRGEQASLEREVVVKQPLGSREQVRLEREAKILAVLEHPNIVPAHDLCWSSDGRPQLVLRRVEGQTWLALAEKGERWNPDLRDPFEEAIRIAITICDALAYAHAKGIVHRDVKPSNIMLGSYGAVYLLDWDIAGTMRGFESSVPRLEDAVAGTPAYMPPEQRAGHTDRLGPWTDTYLLAGSLVHVLTGRPPWMRQGEEFVRVELDRNLPRSLRGMLERALADDPARRFRSAQTMRHALEAFLQRRASEDVLARAKRLAEVALREYRVGDRELGDQAALEAEALFRLAMGDMPDEIHVRTAYRTFTVARVEDALEREEVPVARRLLSALPNAPEPLLAKVRHAEGRARSAAVEIEAHRRDEDRHLGAGVRHRILWIAGGAWCVAWGVGAFTGSILPVFFAVIAALVSLAFAHVLGTRARVMNRLNRARLVSSLLLLVGLLPFILDAWFRDLPFQALAMPASVLLFLWISSLVAVIDRRAWPLAVLWVPVIAGTLVAPTVGKWLAGAAVSITWIAALAIDVRMEGTHEAIRDRDPSSHG
ncbi:MAG: serine/threonine-protein kinase [Myxococcota bacterium]